MALSHQELSFLLGPPVDVETHSPSTPAHTAPPHLCTACASHPLLLALLPDAVALRRLPLSSSRDLVSLSSCSFLERCLRTLRFDCRRRMSDRGHWAVSR
eukprot:2664704-Rhodomonas_salina.1